MNSYQKVSEAQIQTVSEAEIRQHLRELWPISSAGCAPRIVAIKEVFRLQAELERRRAAQEAPRSDADAAGDTANEPSVGA